MNVRLFLSMMLMCCLLKDIPLPYHMYTVCCVLTTVCTVLHR
jgi:hypothetical protein